MPAHLIVVDKLKDFRWPDPGGRVVTADEYLSRSTQFSHCRIINLCRGYGYLSAGYYVSLLSEARGDRAVPDVAAITGMHRRKFPAEHSGGFARLLARLPDMSRSVNAFSLHVYFGEVEDPRFRELAQRVFERLRCPLLRVDLERNQSWRVAALHPLDPRDVPIAHDAFFLHCLDAYVQRRWQRPKATAASRFDLAVLYDAADPLPPSSPKTLERLAEVGRAMEVNVVEIERRDYPKLAQFDALFIRETTSVPHHSFRFARKAEREGMPVIDDPASIIRCTNKVFLAELFRGHDVPTPNTRFLTRRTMGRVEEECVFPVVVKIPDGSFSVGVEKAGDRRQLQNIAERMLKHSEIILLQDFVSTEFDWRIGVLDGEPLFAARYFMCERHWQILKHAADGTHVEGRTQAVALPDVPDAVLDVALRAARLVGRGLYGVDLKQTAAGVFVMEVNDNPNIDLGMEDAVLGDELYRRLLRFFLRKADEMRPGLPTAQPRVALAAGAASRHPSLKVISS